MSTGWYRRGPRLAFTPSERAQILCRDGRVCHVCHKPGADQVDHLTPLAEGGEHLLSNAGAIHGKPCHERKSREEAERGYARRQAKLRLPPERHPFDMES